MKKSSKKDKFLLTEDVLREWIELSGTANGTLSFPGDKDPNYKPIPATGVDVAKIAALLCPDSKKDQVVNYIPDAINLILAASANLNRTNFYLRKFNGGCYTLSEAMEITKLKEHSFRKYVKELLPNLPEDMRPTLPENEWKWNKSYATACFPRRLVWWIKKLSTAKRKARSRKGWLAQKNILDLESSKYSALSQP